MHGGGGGGGGRSGTHNRQAFGRLLNSQELYRFRIRFFSVEFLCSQR